MLNISGWQCRWSAANELVSVVCSGPEILYLIILDLKSIMYWNVISIITYNFTTYFYSVTWNRISLYYD